MPSWDHAKDHALLTGDGIRRPGMQPNEYITATYADEPAPVVEGEVIAVYVPTQDDKDATNWRLV